MIPIIENLLFFRALKSKFILYRYYVVSNVSWITFKFQTLENNLNREGILYIALRF